MNILECRVRLTIPARSSLNDSRGRCTTAAICSLSITAVELSFGAPLLHHATALAYDLCCPIRKPCSGQAVVTGRQAPRISMPFPHPSSHRNRPISTQCPSLPFHVVRPGRKETEGPIVSTATTPTENQASHFPVSHGRSAPLNGPIFPFRAIHASLRWPDRCLRPQPAPPAPQAEGATAGSRASNSTGSQARYGPVAISVRPVGQARVTNSAAVGERPGANSGNLLSRFAAKRATVIDAPRLC